MKHYSIEKVITPDFMNSRGIFIIKLYEELLREAEFKLGIGCSPCRVTLYVSTNSYDEYKNSIDAAAHTIEISNSDLAGKVDILCLRFRDDTYRITADFMELSDCPVGKWNCLPPIGVAWPRTPHIKKVIFNPPATIVMWDDGTKTVVKVQDGDTWDSEKGLALAIIKKTMGLKEFYKHFDEHAVNANFWYYVTPEVLAKKSVYKYGFKVHMDAIVSLYGTDLVKKYLKRVKKNGMEVSE